MKTLKKITSFLLLAISFTFSSFISTSLSTTTYATSIVSDNKTNNYSTPEQFMNELSKMGEKGEKLLNEYSKLDTKQQIKFLTRLKHGDFDVKVVENNSSRFSVRSIPPVHGSHYKTYTHEYYLFGINLLDITVEVHFDYRWHRATHIHHSKSYVSYLMIPFSDLYQSSHYAYIYDGRVHIKSAFTSRVGAHINGIGLYVTPRTFNLTTIAEGNGRIYGHD